MRQPAPTPSLPSLALEEARVPTFRLSAEEGRGKGKKKRSKELQLGQSVSLLFNPELFTISKIVCVNCEKSPICLIYMAGGGVALG